MVEKQRGFCKIAENISRGEQKEEQKRILTLIYVDLKLRHLTFFGHFSKSNYLDTLPVNTKRHQLQNKK